MLVHAGKSMWLHQSPAFRLHRAEHRQALHTGVTGCAVLSHAGPQVTGSGWRAAMLGTASTEKPLVPELRWVREQGLPEEALAAEGSCKPAHTATPSLGGGFSECPCLHQDTHHSPKACANSALSLLVPELPPSAFPAVFPSCRPADRTNSAGSGLLRH